MRLKSNGLIKAFLLVLGICLAISGCALFSNSPPVGQIAASPARGVSPLRVLLDAASSYDADGHITRWSWDFGDGQNGDGESISHVFTNPGIYLVRLTVRDNRWATSVSTTLIEVVESNEPPVARIAVHPASGSAPLSVVLDGTGSSDSDGTIESWTWDFGDGAGGVGSIVSHRYTQPGTYVATLTVSDDLSGIGKVSARIVVSKATPFLRQYEWDYAGRHFNWTVSIPSSLYYEYAGRVRGAWDQRDYDDYVLDPLDDDYLEDLVDWIQAEVGTDFYTTVECLFHFVQAAIDYAYDPLWYEYPRYPVETLVDETGDCEDTAILYASLVRTLGSGAMLAAVDTNHDGTVDHMITLVPVSQAYADATVCANGCVKSFWTYGGQLYAFAETTGEPDLMGYYFELGCAPWGLTAIDFKITWDVSRVSVNPHIERWDPQLP